MFTTSSINSYLAVRTRYVVLLFYQRNLKFSGRHRILDRLFEFSTPFLFYVFIGVFGILSRITLALPPTLFIMSMLLTPLCTCLVTVVTYQYFTAVTQHQFSLIFRNSRTERCNKYFLYRLDIRILHPYTPRTVLSPTILHFFAKLSENKFLPLSKTGVSGEFRYLGIL